MPRRSPPPQPANDPVLTTRQVAAYLQVEVKTVYSWRLRRLGPKAAKVGKHLRFRQSDVDEWLDAQSRAGAA